MSIDEELEMAMIAELTAEEFSEAVATGVVLVDFYATWCGPCKMLAPVLEALAPQYEGRIRFLKADVDALQDLAIRYEVRSVPTLLIFRDGEVVDTLVGFQSQAALQRALDGALA